MENSSGIHSEAELKKKAEETVARMNKIRREYSEILEHTLNFDDKLPWEQMMKSEDYTDFWFEGQKPEPPKEEKKKFLSFLDKTAERKKEYISQLQSYKREKNAALLEYLDKREKYSDDALSYNTELDCLRHYFEKSEKSAVEEYAYLVLDRSQYPESLNRNYHVKYNKEKKTLEVYYLFPSLNDFPNTVGYEYIPEKRRIEWKMASYEQALEFYDHTILTVCLRTLHELFEGVYNGSVNAVIFNGYVRNGACKTPSGRVSVPFEEAFVHNVRCVFGVKADRKRFSEITLDSRKTEKILELFQMKRARNFHDALQLMAPITADDD